MDGLLEEWLGGWMEGLVNGWMDVWGMNGRMSGWMFSILLFLITIFLLFYSFKKFSISN
jgi:hypothetical protein